MAKEITLLDRIYKEPLYQEICRFVGYSGTTYRELRKKLELLGEAYGKTRSESAQAHLLAYDGQFTATPKPLAEVKLRSDVRKYCFQLLGPPPEQWDSYYRNADGTPGPQYEAKMAELERLTGKRPAPASSTKPARGKKRAVTVGRHEQGSHEAPQRKKISPPSRRKT